MPSLRPHITVEDLRIGWGSRVLMEHVNFRGRAGIDLRDTRRLGERQEYVAAVFDRP